MIDDLGHSELADSPFKNIFSWEELQRKLVDFQASMKSADTDRLNADNLPVRRCINMSDRKSHMLHSRKTITLS